MCTALLYHYYWRSNNEHKNGEIITFCLWNGICCFVKWKMVIFEMEKQRLYSASISIFILLSSTLISILLKFSSHSSACSSILSKAATTGSIPYSSCAHLHSMHANNVISFACTTLYIESNTYFACVPTSSFGGCRNFHGYYMYLQYILSDKAIDKRFQNTWKCLWGNSGYM